MKTRLSYAGFFIGLSIFCYELQAYPQLPGLTETQKSVSLIRSDTLLIRAGLQEDGAPIPANLLGYYQRYLANHLEPEYAYWQTVESFLLGDQTSYKLHLTTFEAWLVSTYESEGVIHLDSYSAYRVLNLYINILAAEFDTVNMKILQAALHSRGAQHLSIDNLNICEIIYAHTATDASNIDALSKLTFREPFDQAVAHYYLAKLNRNLESAVIAADALSEFIKTEEVSSREPTRNTRSSKFDKGLASLFLLDVYELIFDETKDYEIAELALITSHLARSNIDAVQYAPFYGLAYANTADLMETIYEHDRHALEIERVREIGEMFR